jgi:hypothetical protein
MTERVKGKQDSNGAAKADEAYAQVLGAIQALTVLHVELPGPKETKGEDGLYANRVYTDVCMSQSASTTSRRCSLA